jgi:hypothetical protein
VFKIWRASSIYSRVLDASELFLSRASPNKKLAHAVNSRVQGVSEFTNSKYFFLSRLIKQKKYFWKKLASSARLASSFFGEDRAKKAREFMNSQSKLNSNPHTRVSELARSPNFKHWSVEAIFCNLTIIFYINVCFRSMAKLTRN